MTAQPTAGSRPVQPSSRRGADRTSHCPPNRQSSRCRASNGGPGTAVTVNKALDRAACKREAVQAAQALVASEHPELSDVAGTGLLLFVPRPTDYVERRTDGYREPERVFIIAVNHADSSSAAIVDKTIQALRPDNVVVELCRSRAGVMYSQDASVASSATRSREAERLRASGLRKLVREALDGNRSLPGLLLTLLSGRMQARMGEQLGADIGGEMRAARLAAEAVGAQLVLGVQARKHMRSALPPALSGQAVCRVLRRLGSWQAALATALAGDRPIEITLERAWAALPWRSRPGVLGALLLAPVAPLPGAGKQPLPAAGDAVDDVMARFAAAYPEVAAAVLDERDLYLAWSLKRSKAVDGCRTVVGVVGGAHAAGVAYHLRTPSQLRFRDLVGRREARPAATLGVPRWVGVLAGNLALAAGLQAAWEALSRQGG